MDKPEKKKYRNLTFSVNLRHCITTVFDALEHSKNNLNQFLDLLLARIEAETSFARSLKQIGSKWGPLEKSELGSLRRAIISAGADMSNHRRARMDYADSMTEEVYIPVKEFKEIYTATSNRLLTESKKILKEWNTIDLRYSRVRGQYKKVAMEAKAARDAVINAKSQGLNSQQVIKLGARVNEFMRAVVEWSEKHDTEKTIWSARKIKFEKNIDRVLDQLQKNEEDRIETLKDTLRKWVIYETSLNANRKYDIAGLVDIMDSVNHVSDLTLFVEKTMIANPPAVDPTTDPKVQIFSPSKQWRNAVILDEKEGNILIHYIGFSKKWDEWIARDDTNRCKFPVDEDTDDTSSIILIDDGDKRQKKKDRRSSWLTGLVWKGSSEDELTVPSSSPPLDAPTTPISQRRRRFQVLEILNAGATEVNGLYVEQTNRLNGCPTYEMRSKTDEIYSVGFNAGNWFLKKKSPQEILFYRAQCTENDFVEPPSTKWQAEGLGKDPPPKLELLQSTPSVSPPQNNPSDPPKPHGLDKEQSDELVIIEKAPTGKLPLKDRTSTIGKSISGVSPIEIKQKEEIKEEAQNKKFRS